MGDWGFGFSLCASLSVCLSVSEPRARECVLCVAQCPPFLPATSAVMGELSLKHSLGPHEPEAERSQPLRGAEDAEGRKRGAPASPQGPRGKDSGPGSEGASGLDGFPATGRRPGFRFHWNDEFPTARGWLQSLAGAGLSPGPPSIKGQLPGSPPPLHSATEGLSPRLRPSGLVTKLLQPASLSLPPARPDTTCHQPGGLTGETRQTGRVCMKLGEFAHLLMASQPPSESREPQLMTYHLAVASPSEGLFLWPLK